MMDYIIIPEVCQGELWTDWAKSAKSAPPEEKISPCRRPED